MQTELIDKLKALGAPDHIIDQGVLVYELHWPGTNEVYVGSTAHTLEERLSRHQNDPRKCYAHLGIENAVSQVICHYLPHHRFDREPERQYKDVQRARGYAVLDDGDRHTAALWRADEVKQKISKAKRGKQHTEKTKRKMSASRTGAKNWRYAPFTVTWPDGRIDHWDTTTEAATAYGIGIVTVWKYLKGTNTPGGNKRTVHLKGCRFEYV